MKKLFNLLKARLLTHFDKDNTDFHLENFKMDNGQMYRLEEMTQFNFPAILFRTLPITWRNLPRKVRYTTADFELNLIIESYKEIEDSFELDDYIELIKNYVTTLSYNDEKYNISTPWVVSEDRGFNETNLMSFRVVFRCNITDFTNINDTEGELEKIIINHNIIDSESDWILGNGFWNDSLLWDDTKFWVD